MSNPLISVIVPVYKVEPYLRDCINSILKQTYDNLDIILVDDGSPDECPQICDEYTRLDNRVRVIHKENGGLSDARNTGIAAAKGKFLSFIDSDDIISLNFIESLYEPLAMLDEPCVSVCAFRPFYKKDVVALNCDEGASFKISLESLLEQNSSMNIFLSMECNSACNKLFSVELFKLVRFPKGKLYEDVATTHKLLFEAKSIYYVPQKLYNYRVRQDSIMGTQVFSERYLDFIESLHESIKWFEHKGLSQYSQFYYPALLMPEMYAWWGLKHCVKDVEKADVMLMQYRQDVKLTKTTRFFKRKHLWLFMLLARVPFLYELYRKIAPGLVGGR